MQICKDGCGTENSDTATQCQRCGRSLRSALRLHNPGTLVRHYRIRRVIGWGGFGAVYEAEDTRQPGSRVALKESFDPSGMTSFQSEFAALQQHQHPQLPRYGAMFVDQGNGYLVMEFIPGQSLEDVQKAAGGPLSETQVLGFALQLCEVLTYLHRQNPPILHRDLKPANVRLTPSGLIKLVDFGLFKQGTDTTQSSRMGLTPAYAPVEQHPLAPGHTDQRSDIYSLGATLYHLLTGQMPVSSFDRIQARPDPLVPSGRLNPRLSPHIAAAISKAMSLKPENRYPDIVTFQQALLGQQTRQPTPQQVQVRQQAQVRQQTPSSQPKQHTAPAWKRYNSPLAGVGLGALLVLLVLVFAFANRSVQSTRLAVAPTVAVAPTMVITPMATPLPWPSPVPTVTPTATPPPWVPEMVIVPAGDFLMGSNNADPQAQWDGEKPQHTLTLPAYEIAKTEVTNAQFRPFVEGDGYTKQTYWDDAGWQWRTEQQRTQPGCWNDARWNGDQRPIVCVTLYEALAYTRWLSAQTGQHFSLPTEAEWEKAARGPNGLIYPWGNTWEANRANSSEAGFNNAVPVGQYPGGTSPYGALDMAGNVWEWTRSIYMSYPYDSADGRDNLSDLAQKKIIVRGGSWNFESFVLRAAARTFIPPTTGSFLVGIRLIRPL
ncbi:MAG: bifunctional serine/threonine-protein kinase/formylglycine-generating enzyme family protein [Chloroflexales bacterium]